METELVGYAASANAREGTALTAVYSGARKSADSVREWAAPLLAAGQVVHVWCLYREPPEQIAAAKRLGLPLPVWHHWPALKVNTDGN